MNIALIGYRGTGKTTISKLLADELSFKLVSTDELVVSSGWNKFRQYEKEAIKEISQLDDCECQGAVILR